MKDPDDCKIDFRVPTAYERMAPQESTARVYRKRVTGYSPRFSLTCDALTDKRMPGDNIPSVAEKSLWQDPETRPEFQRMGSARFRIGDREAFAISFVFRDESAGEMLQERLISVARNRVLYVFTFVASQKDFARVSKDFESVIKSVRWLP